MLPKLNLTLNPLFNLPIAMKLAAVLPMITTLAATTFTQAEIIQSTPFSILVLSADPFYNGTYLTWTRAGPYVEKMTFSNITHAINDFYLNSTQYTAWGTLGVDQHMASSSGNFVVPLSFQLASDLSTNIASTWMSSQKGTDLVDFDKEGLMNLQVGGHDDSKMPDAKLVMGGPRALYRWVACKEFGPYGGVIDTLMWVVGGKPQNPTCVDISLKRV
jgi:hypothetical protein